ncbi:hypothetical protein FHS61_001750 [Altererythrobacter atlanticus]|uniref:Uncharacterized protein n=1 Tax=Croceibacterium atlanticum TaxID=1267766 RepID=A0A0F7KKY0_9SPHN|nr:DUF4139 domain-containing protein [Croceibacterium atlanticum]AKH41223.1 hypothetical protein WYH_00157 [Croceibacterium atlanticum]MBB5732741.1 hypothetical protein [Croceibacterium atlanticum]
MKKNRLTIAAISLATFAWSAPPVSAQTSSADGESAQGDLSVTIYNGNLALVQDVRQLEIASGRSRIAFPDVSAQIRPETLSFAARDTAIVEQNFDFDLLTPSKMMEKAIGQTVTLVRTNPATGAETRERAKVLSTAGGTVVQIGDRIEVLRDDGLPVRVVFDRVPPNLRAKPTLSVTVESSSSGTRPASIRYLTPGLGWSSDYVALYDEGRGTVDMQGWVTLTNSTGTTFHSADTLLVAGNPNGSSSRQPGRGYNPRIAPDISRTVPGTETAERERLGDYYLYPIAERTTIANNQTKQVSFLDVQGVPARKIYGRTVGWLASDTQPVNVSSQIAFSSSKEGGLGDALPAGTVRFYQRDGQGNPQFIGENGIGHTPMGSELVLSTGDAFDVFVQAEVEKREPINAAEYERSARYRVIENGEAVREVQLDRAVTHYRTTMRYTLTNAKPEPVEVELVQSGLDRGWWASDYRIPSEDVPGEQLNADARKYVISVPANGERVVRVTYETRY